MIRRARTAFEFRVKKAAVWMAFGKGGPDISLLISTVNTLGTGWLYLHSHE
jgi:hypothetical protein